MTQFKDSRVSAAFNDNRLQYSYMIGSEQRLTGAENLIATQAGQISSGQANLGILNSWINYYNNSLWPNVVYRNSSSATLGDVQINTTSSSFVDTGFTISVNLSAPNLFVFFSSTEFWVSSGASAANADLAFQLNSDPEVIVCRAYSDNSPNQNTYGITASYLYDFLPSGTYTIKARWRTSPGTTAYLGGPFVGSKIQLFVFQY